MQTNFEELEYITGDSSIVQEMINLQPLPLFCDEVIAFLNDLSQILIKTGREYSDVTTFGFWCRKASIMQEKEKYDDIEERLGRGIVFHSTPSNVPVNFAFSLVTGMLSGNANIVRLPGKDFEQVKIISDAINELLEKNHTKLKPYLCMVKYPSKKEISDAFSSICDSRVIWGGDNTINNLRQSPLKPRANEITFADRYSIAIINADEYLNTENKTKIAQDFYNDTYFSDQNACTTPVTIFWLGNNKEQAKKEFWSNLHKLVESKYQLKPVQAVGKLNALYKLTSVVDAKVEKSEDNLITRISIKNLSKEVMEYKYNSGFFFECEINKLSEVLPIVSNICQTLTYFGISKNELETFLKTNRPNGIDRMVPIGKSMDFSLTWDGYDLIRTLSRKITIQ